MPTPTLKDNEIRNPGQNDWDSKVGQQLASAEQGATRDAQENSRKLDDTPQEDTNVRELKDSEQNDTGKSDDSTTESKRKEEPSTKSTKRMAAINFLSQKGPLGLIISIFLGGGLGLFSLMGPGIAIVQWRDTVVSDLQDQAASMDERSQHIFRAKIKGSTKGFCTKSLSFRCGYKNISKTHAKKLLKAGFRFEPALSDQNSRTATGRVKVSALTYIDSNGEKRTVRANDFAREYQRNAEFRSKMVRVYNPRFAGLKDKLATGVYTKFKVSWKRALSGDRDNMREQIDKTVKEGNNDEDLKRRGLTKQTTEDGREVWVDKDGIEQPDNPDEGMARINELTKEHGTARGIMTSGLRAANTFSGMQAAACSIYTLTDALSLVSRNARFAQLLRFAVPMLNTADTIQTGEGTMEAVEMMGDMATQVDLREKLVTEKSIPSMDENGNIIENVQALSSNGEEIKIDPVENPDYGKNSFDSSGFKLGAYGEVSDLSIRDQQFSLASGLSGVLDSIGSFVLKTVAGGKNSCDFWTNPIVQGAGLLLSLGVLVFSGGTSVIGQGAKAVAQTVLVAFLTSWLIGQITDAVEGNGIDSDTKGVDAGNAWFAGSAALMSSTASTRGLNPLSTEAEIKESQAIQAAEENRYAEVARLEAKDTPFDVYNQYSFMGSIASQVVPKISTAGSTLSAMFTSPFTYFSIAGNFASPANASAAVSPVDRFQKCADPALNRINLETADVFCNIRFGNSRAELNSDPEKIAEWMVNAGQADAVSGEAVTTKEAMDAIEAVRTDSSAISAVLEPASDNIAVDGNLSDSLASGELADVEQLPPPVGAYEERFEDGENYRTEEDARTYAHWIKYCRFGDENGRELNFGDPEGPESNILTGLTNDKYQSDGRECLKSNACAPGDDPNGQGFGEDAMKTRCRPAQYDVYSVFFMDQSIVAGMDAEDTESAEGSTSGLVTGEAKELAKKLTEEPNIEFVNPATKEALLKFSETGEATNSCGEPFSINPLLSGILLTNAGNGYKVLINNFGFKEDRYSCDSGQHPKGNAVDLNGIEKEGQTAKPITFSGGEVPLIEQYSIDWMNGLAQKDPARGGVGQLNCGGFNITAKRDAKWQGPDGMLHFDDSCDHLHIDVRDRNDGSKI